MNSDRLIKILEKLVQLPSETEWVEFRVNNSNPVEIGEKISGLANSANLLGEKSSYLVFGVANQTHDIVGTEFDPRLAKVGAEELQNWWARHLNPRIDFRIHEFFYNDKKCVLLEIPPAIDQPVSFKDTSYVRIGSINKSLKEYPDKERKIWNNVYNKNFETGIALSGLDGSEVLNKLDYPGFFILTKQELPDNKVAILKKLEDDKIIVDDFGQFNITNMGALLFAKDLNDFERIKRKAVRVIIYNGKNRVKTIKEQESKVGYAVGLERLIDYIEDQLPANEEIRKVFRVERKMYPELAIRELIANALIHQDFCEKGSGPMIELFQDRIEITNPGKPLISIDRFIDQSPQSRNEKLASFMRRIRICEEKGSGIDKVVAQAEIYQLPAPKFEATGNSTKAILYAYKALSKMDKHDKIRACYQHCVLRYVSNETMTNSSLRKRFNIKDENSAIASRIINITVKAGVIKLHDPQQSGSKKHRKYIPIWA